MKKFIFCIIVFCVAGCVRVSAEEQQAVDFVATYSAETLAALPSPTSIPPTQTPIVIEVQTPEITSIQNAQQPNFAAQNPEGTLPDSHYIWDIWGHRQYFGLGCESAAVVDWAAYFDVPITEFLFQTRLPLSDNPDLGFVGSVEGPWGQVPPYAYGVHAAPIAELLRSQYEINAAGEKDLTIEDLKPELASGQPVIAWVIGNCVGGIPHEYIDKDGRSVTVAAYEHVVILTGYDEDSIRYMNNGKFYDIPYENFANTWGVLGNMAVYLAD